MYSMQQLKDTKVFYKNLTYSGLQMADLKKDLVIGTFFITGLWGFISGAFIVSTVLMGAAAMFSNIFLRERLD